ncbi:pyruvate kinase [Novipirellula artificiosorum]|uniref:Pyruvate kinase n=1 Tax=Novipirellula artificiosorum TaxID=2528016 RepID=A0A5C6DZI8_9BACT|nr:pyruvate kinase [Novipirellula artificiosorum]TWU42040.1 Pyruvate kinase [Novipirellula artificiosorum]
MSRPRIAEASTKIVATVGPACSSTEKLAELIEAGVDVFRINTAHGDRLQHETVVANIRAAGKQTGFDPAILLDLAGPKIRLGQLITDPLTCDIGETFSFIRGDASTTDHELTSTYAKLVDELSVGDRVMLADGMVSMKVENVTHYRADCCVTASGTVRSRQGINLPGVRLSVSAMRKTDVDNAIWGAQNGIDFISLSFVRKPEDVQSLKNLLVSYESQALVIAKIEKPEALEHLDAIVDVSDGIMVARGDLGVEIDVAETPVAQKRIISVCKQKMKPVIVATQMLESMHDSSRPTRAEASDVANAILDGADACMLSGETAIGHYPVQSVEMMNRIMICTEREMLKHPTPCHHPNTRVHAITTAVTDAATNIAESIDAKLIVIVTKSGDTAWVKSQSRSRVPTLGVSDSSATLRRMNLLWGIKPIRSDQFEHTTKFIDEICQWGRANMNLKAEDQVVLVTGTGVIKKAHNMLIVHTVE